MLTQRNDPVPFCRRKFNWKVNDVTGIVFHSLHVHNSTIMSKGLAVVLAESNYECLEVHYPRLRLIEAGYTVQVAGPKAGETYTSKEGKARIFAAFF